MNKPRSPGPLSNFVQSPTGLALVVFLAVAGYFLWTEHRAHTITALPYVLLGGCLVMHFFMHRGHGHGDHGEGNDQPTSDADHNGNHHHEIANRGGVGVAERTGQREAPAGTNRKDGGQQ